MKSYKLLFLATLAFAATQSFAQEGKVKKVRNLGIVSAPKQLLTEPQVPLMLRQEQGLGTTLPDFHTDAVTSQKIGSSANYYTYSNNGQKQISVSKDVKAVSFIFRNNPNVSGAGNSGHLRYNVSSDGGITWAVPFTGTGIGAINPAQTGLARYPDAFLFAPVGITTLTANTVTATNGQNNGSISLTATGGLGSYTYQILNPAGNVVSTKNTATGLPSGTYTVLVADSFGCGDTHE